MANLPAAIEALVRLAVRGIALISGIFAILREVFLLYRAEIGQPVPPDQALTMLGHWAWIAFGLSVAIAWWQEHSRVLELERERDPESALMRAQYQQEIAKLAPTHIVTLYLAATSGGDIDAAHLVLLLQVHSVQLDHTGAVKVLAEIERGTSFFAVRDAQTYSYEIKAAWKPVVQAWALRTTLHKLLPKPR